MVRLYSFLSLIPMCIGMIWGQCVSSEVLTAAGDSSITLCPSDGIPDPVAFVSSDEGDGEYSFVLCDENDVIQFALPVALVDFDGFGEGVSHIYGVSYTGDLLAPNGMNISEISSTGSCALVSDNFVEIIREIPTIGEFGNGLEGDTLEICAGDGIPDLVDPDLAGITIGELAFVVSSDANEVIAVLREDQLDFDFLESGTFAVRGVAFSGNLAIGTGDSVLLDTATISDDCFDLTVGRFWLESQNFNTGSIQTTTEEVEVFVCPQNGTADWIGFVMESNQAEDSVRWIITDTADIVEQILAVDSFDFDGSPIGECLVYGIRSSEEIEPVVGENLFGGSLSSNCYDLSDLAIRVIKDIPQSPEIRGPEQTLEVFACTGDDQPDRLEFESLNNPRGRLQLIITLPDGLVIGLPNTTSVDFENIGEGVCHVHALSYTGELRVQIGTFLDPMGDLASDCFALSDTFVTVTKVDIDGGDLFTTSDSVDFFAVCPDDVDSDTLFLSTNSTSNALYTFLLTDDAGVIIEELEEGLLATSSLPNGVYRCYGLSYLGATDLEVGDSLILASGEFDPTLVSSCGELSRNFVEVQKIPAVAGNVDWNIDSDSLYYCPSEEDNMVVTLDSSGASGLQYRWLFVDQSGTIRSVQEDAAFLLSQAEVGISLIYGLSYFGDLLAEPGVSIHGTLATGCFDVSGDFVYLEINEAHGDSIRYGDDRVTNTLCVGDGLSDFIELNTTGQSTLRYEYLLCNQNFEFIQLLESELTDFESFPAGIYSIFGLSYTGEITLSPGESVPGSVPSSSCWDLSDNFLVLILNGIDEHVLLPENGQANLFICPEGTGTKDLRFAYESDAVNETLVLTNSSGEVIDIVDTAVYSFVNLGPESIFIQSVHYIGELLVEIGDSIEDQTQWSDDCFRLSSNVVEVSFGSPSLDSIFYTDGGFEEILCPQAMGPNLLPIDVAALDGYATTLLTTADSIILFVSENEVLDISNFPEGEYLVFGLSYTGELETLVGSRVSEVMNFSNDCWDLSSNSLSLIKENPVGGQLLADGSDDALEICAGDGISDIVSFETMGSEGSQYVYLLLDDMNRVLGISGVDSLDLDQASAGDYSIWGLAYTGELVVNFGDSLTADLLLSDDCFSLSENAIAARVSEADPALISWADLAERYVSCVDEPDSLPVSIVGGQGEEEILLLVDGQGQIIRLIPVGSTNALEGLALGEYQLYHLYYSGDLLVSAGDMFDEDSQFSSLCYALSTQSLRIERGQLSAHEILYEGIRDTAQICAVGLDSIQVDIEGEGGLDYVFLVVNSAGNILGISGGMSPLGISEYGDGIIGVIGLSYSGDLLVQTGDNITIDLLASGCFQLSDNRLWLDIRRPEIEDLNFIDGETEMDLCTDQDSVEIEILAQASSAYDVSLVWVDRDADTIYWISTGDVITLPVSNVELEIFAVHHEEGLLSSVGEEWNPGEIASGCFEVGATPLLLDLTQILGGRIQSAEGEETVRICLADEEFDVVQFELTEGSTGFNEGYILVDLDGRVENFSQNPAILFTGSETDTCQVYGVRYETENLSIVLGESLEDALTGEECIALTRNSVEVIKIGELEDCVVSAENIGNSEVRLYPNPSDGTFWIRDENGRGYQFELRDVRGQLVLAGNTLSERPYRIAKAGMYFLVFKNETGTFVQKLIIQ